MDKERILGILRAHQPELRAAGIVHLRLFGSVVRGENSPASDIDLLFDYDDTSNGDLLGAYGLQDRVAEIVGAPVHLSSAKHIKPQIRERVLREAVLAF